MTEDRAALPPGLALAWGVQPVSRRGPRPGLSVGQIVATGIDLGDSDGYAAISLQKIAARLGVTTNALYRYVGSKDELLVLIRETAWGPPPAVGGDDWRTAAGTWVRAQLDRYATRPWLLDLPITGAPVTPNLLGWAEVLLQALDPTGLDPQDGLGCVLLLDGYARSYAGLARQLSTAATTQVGAEQVGAFLLPRLATAYPMLTRLYAGQANADGLGADGLGADGLGDDDLEFGLTRILDGIQTLVDRRGSAG